MSARKTTAATVAAKPASKGAAPTSAKRISVKKVAVPKSAPAKLAPNAAGDASVTAKKLAADIDRALAQGQTDLLTMDAIQALMPGCGDDPASSSAPRDT